MKTFKEFLLSENKDKKNKKSDDPCWDGYEQYGMKEKDGKKVPNCVKEEQVPSSSLINFEKRQVPTGYSYPVTFIYMAGVHVGNIHHKNPHHHIVAMKNSHFAVSNRDVAQQFPYFEQEENAKKYVERFLK